MKKLIFTGIIACLTFSCTETNKGNEDDSANEEQQEQKKELVKEAVVMEETPNYKAMLIGDWKIVKKGGKDVPYTYEFNFMEDGSCINTVQARKIAMKWEMQGEESFRLYAPGNKGDIMTIGEITESSMTLNYTALNKPAIMMLERK